MTFTNVGVLHKKIAATGLAVGLAHLWYAVSLRGQGRVMRCLLQRIQDHLVGILCAVSVLLAGVNFDTLHPRGSRASTSLAHARLRSARLHGRRGSVSTSERRFLNCRSAARRPSGWRQVKPARRRATDDDTRLPVP